VLNLYDGFTGIATHPYQDAKKQGVKGFCKGVGRGVGGFVFKTMAAVIGVPAYTLKGVEKQIEKRSDRDLKTEIIAIRMRQGLAAFRRASEEEKQDIMKRWKEFGVA
jgi:sterol 3beta-glucosyltransferase